MHQTDHISDVQLNEYLDGESNERASIETHLSTCAECAARLDSLQSLFAEIESLPEVALTRPVAARFTPPPELNPQLPRWLTLTMAAQSFTAIAAIVLAAPFVGQLLEPYLQSAEIPSWSGLVLELQFSLLEWTQVFQGFSIPEVSTIRFDLPPQVTPEFLTLTLCLILGAWALGNWWLLHKTAKTIR